MLFLLTLDYAGGRLPDETLEDLNARKKYLDWKCTPAGRQTISEINWGDLNKAFEIANRILDLGSLDVEDILRSGMTRQRFDQLLPDILCQNSRLEFLKPITGRGAKKRGRAFLDALPDDSPEALARIAEMEAEIRAEVAAQDYGWLWEAATDE